MASGGRKTGGIQIGEARKGMHVSRHPLSWGVRIDSKLC